MKIRITRGATLLLACALVLVIVPAYAGEEKSGKDEAVTCGADIGESPEVSLAEVIKAPDEYLGKTVTVTGIAAEICQKKGCWMQVVPKDGEPGLRMTFKDYGFFVPMDGAGMLVRAEGVFEMKTLDKDHVDHLLAEGARIAVNEDGTADELGFVASGVVMSGEKKAVKADKEEKEHAGCSKDDKDKEEKEAE